MTTYPADRAFFMAKILRPGLLVVILATLVPYGAVNPFWFHLAALLNGLLFACTLAIPFRNTDLARVHRTALILLLLIVAYLLFQSIQLPNFAFANPIWENVHDFIKLQGGTISVSPAGTIATIPVLVHPFLIFLAVLILHQNDDSALTLWHRLSLIAGGIAVFGLIQHIVFPRSLLFGEKLHYLDSVTGTFVNRNSAATLFGIAALLSLGVLARSFQQLYAQQNQPSPTTQYNRRIYQIIFLRHVGLFVVVLLALFLTESRGGLVSTFIPLVLISAWFGYSITPSVISPRIRMVAAGFTVTALILAFAVLGARSLFRIERQGTDDPRWCVFKSTIVAIKDNPWFGTGFGTFDQLFPVYRNPECGIAGVWDRAHNSFLEGYLGMGLPFAATVLFVLIYLISVFMVGYHARQRFRIIPLIGMGTLLLMILHSMVDFSLQIPGVAAYFAATLGAAVAISLTRKRSNRI